MFHSNSIRRTMFFFVLAFLSSAAWSMPRAEKHLFDDFKQFGEWTRLHGSWNVVAGGGLRQNDEQDFSAYIYRELVQQGPTAYTFDLTFGNGSDDGRAVFSMEVLLEAPRLQPVSRNHLVKMVLEIIPGSGGERDIYCRLFKGTTPGLADAQSDGPALYVDRLPGDNKVRLRVLVDPAGGIVELDGPSADGISNRAAVADIPSLRYYLAFGTDNVSVLIENLHVERLTDYEAVLGSPADIFLDQPFWKYEGDYYRCIEAAASALNREESERQLNNALTALDGLSRGLNAAFAADRETADLRRRYLDVCSDARKTIEEYLGGGAYSGLAKLAGAGFRYDGYFSFLNSELGKNGPVIALSSPDTGYTRIDTLVSDSAVSSVMDELVESFETAVKEKPEDTRSLYTLSQLYQQSGNYERSYEYLVMTLYYASGTIGVPVKEIEQRKAAVMTRLQGETAPPPPDEVIIVKSRSIEEDIDVRFLRDYVNSIPFDKIDSVIASLEARLKKEPDSLNLLFTLNYLYEKKGLKKNQYEVLTALDENLKKKPELVFNIVNPFAAKQRLRTEMLELGDGVIDKKALLSIGNASEFAYGGSRVFMIGSNPGFVKKMNSNDAIYMESAGRELGPVYYYCETGMTRGRLEVQPAFSVSPETAVPAGWAVEYVDWDGYWSVLFDSGTRIGLFDIVQQTLPSSGNDDSLIAAEEDGNMSVIVNNADFYGPFSTVDAIKKVNGTWGFVVTGLDGYTYLYTSDGMVDGPRMPPLREGEVFTISPDGSAWLYRYLAPEGTFVLKGGKSGNVLYGPYDGAVKLCFAEGLPAAWSFTALEADGYYLHAWNGDIYGPYQNVPFGWCADASLNRAAFAVSGPDGYGIIIVGAGSAYYGPFSKADPLGFVKGKLLYAFTGSNGYPVIALENGGEYGPVALLNDVEIEAGGENAAVLYTTGGGQAVEGDFDVVYSVDSGILRSGIVINGIEQKVDNFLTDAVYDFGGGKPRWAGYTEKGDIVVDGKIVDTGAVELWQDSTAGLGRFRWTTLENGTVYLSTYEWLKK